MVKIRWMMACGMMAMTGVSRADLRADFEKEYPAAEAKIEEAYSHVRMEGTWTSEWDSNTKPMMNSYHFELSREGEAFKHVLTLVKATSEEGWPAGSVIVTGGDVDWNYEFHRGATEKAFTFDSVGTRADFESWRGNEWSGTLAPYKSGGARLAEWVKAGWKRVSVLGNELNGKQVVDVSMEWRAEGLNTPQMTGMHWYFQPGTWVLVGTQLNMPRTGAYRFAEYAEAKGGEVPRLKGFESYYVEPAWPGMKQQHLTVEVTRCEFGEVPAWEFGPDGLKGMGVTEIPTEEELKARKAAATGAATQP